MTKINNSYESNDSSLVRNQAFFIARPLNLCNIFYDNFLFQSSGSDTLAPLNKTLENLEAGTATVQSLMLPSLPTDMNNDDHATNQQEYVVRASDDDFVRSSASSDDGNVDPFKALKLTQEQERGFEESPEISDQDVKIRNFLNTRTSAISSELVNEEAVSEPTVVPSFEGDANDLSFQGKLGEFSIFGPKSPEDLFEDDDFDEEIYGFQKSDNSGNSSGLNIDETGGNETVRKLLTNESRLLKRMQRSLTGILPPPSVTASKLTISELLEQYRANSNIVRDPVELSHDESMFLPNSSTEETQTVSWPDAFHVQGHGVCYNRSRNTEKIELVALELVERYIGCETVSSYTTTVKSPQSTKKRALKSKAVMQSPGRRLSHLARRRAIFSSANLKQGGASNRQIVLNPKRQDQKRLFMAGQKVTRTPKRSRIGTPSKKKTPRSSKKPREVIIIKSTITREQSKRALFQSPALVTTEPPKPMVSEDVAKRVEKSKRALFSPAKKLDRSTSFNENSSRLAALRESSRYKSLNNLDQMIGHKRKRMDDADPVDNWCKMPRLLPSNNENECPSSSTMLKSQSFHVLSQPTPAGSRVSFYRSRTDINETISQRKLSEHHKQKLLWAVATALKNKNIISSHPDYKKYASNLTRVVKTLFLQFADSDPQISGIQSTSEKLKRIANNHVYSIIKGASYATLIARERERIENLKTFKKLDGYIAPDEYKPNTSMLSRRNSSNVFYSDVSSLDSSSFSQFSSVSQMSNFSQFTNKEQTQDENVVAHETTTRTSSSKKNGDSFALKENQDRQRSTQKSQTTKVHQTGAGVLKAKRQISFDN